MAGRHGLPLKRGKTEAAEPAQAEAQNPTRRRTRSMTALGQVGIAHALANSCAASRRFAARQTSASPLAAGKVSVSKKIGLVTILLGASAVAALAYGVTRRSGPKRAAETRPSAASGLAWRGSGESEAELLMKAEHELGTAPDPLDLALNLDGIFETESVSSDALSVQFSDRVPLPTNGDDQDPPSPDDLGRTWLEQATESEPSLSVAELTPELENLSLDQLAADARDDDGDEEQADSAAGELEPRAIPRRARG